MDPALQQALTVWIQSLQKGQDFVVQQAPSVIQQWLHVALVLDIVGSIIVVLSFALCVGLLLWRLSIEARTRSPEVYRDDMSAVLIGGLSLATGISGVSMVMTLALNIYDILMIELAPKVWVLHELLKTARMLHGGP